MKVLHVAETAKGGVGSFLDELIPLQCETLGAQNVLALVPAEHRSQLASVADENLVLFSRPDRSFGALRSFREDLQRTVATFGPDIVHLQSSFAGVIGRLLVNHGGSAKVIYNPHGWSFEMWPGGPKRAVASAIERLLSRRCDRIVAVSAKERDQALAAGLPAGKVSVVLNGIAPRMPDAEPVEWNDHRIRVLFVGRLDRQKGFDTLSRIAMRHGQELAIRVVGASVASSAGTVERLDNVEHLGWLDRSEINGLLQACDVIAMPSRWEGLPIVALEAMRAAKPIVAFDVGGLPEIIEDGVTGRLAAAGDEAAFETALLSQTRIGWQAMGQKARAAFYARFTAQRMSAELLELYAAP